MFYFTSKTNNIITCWTKLENGKKLHCHPHLYFLLFLLFFFKGNLLFNLSWIKHGRKETYYITVGQKYRIVCKWGIWIWIVHCLVQCILGVEHFLPFEEGFTKPVLADASVPIYTFFAIVWEVPIHAIFPVIWFSYQQFVQDKDVDNHLFIF